MATPSGILTSSPVTTALFIGARSDRPPTRWRLPIRPIDGANRDTDAAILSLCFANIPTSAEPGRRSLACPCVREGDPECKVSQDMGVWPRHAHLTARIASPQAACPHEIE
jgi:hypothetical protein